MVEFYDSFSKLVKEDKLAVAKELRDEAWYANLEWLESAEKAHKFKAGDQWTENEKAKIEAQDREALVWNYIHSTIELACGVLSQNPIRIYPYPIEKNDAFLCQILEDLITHIDTEQLNAFEIHKNMFENKLITGIGDVVVDVGPDPENPVELEFYEYAMDAYEVLVDPKSKRTDLKDARYVLYEKWVTYEEFKIRYPKQVKHIQEIFEAGTSGISRDVDQTISSLTDDYSGQSSNLFDYYDSQNKRILVTNLEYREAYLRYYLINENGNSKEITKEQVKEVKKNKTFTGRIAELYDTKVHWLHFIPEKILWEGTSPVYQKDFSVCRDYAYTDRSKRQYTYYGLVKLLIDPQRECNKRWMQTLKLLGKQGIGIVAEIDAFHDLDQAQESWADPDAITWIKKGGLQKYKEKTSPDFPIAPMKLEELNREAMKNISGVNPDLMGIAQQRREPGINLKLRQRQGLTILSKLFENHKVALKEIYKRKLEIIVKYMPESQIMRILGESEKYDFQQGYIVNKENQMVAPIRKVRDLRYNVRIEDAPGGMTKMMTELSIFMDMLEKGFPTDPNTIIDKLDLSPIEKANWKKFIAQQQKGKQEAQQVEFKLKQAKMKLDADKAKGDQQIEKEKLRLTQQGKLQDNQVKAHLGIDATAQKERDSRRDLAIKMAEMDAAEKRDLVDILKFLAEREDNSVTPTVEGGKNATSAVMREGVNNG